MKGSTGVRQVINWCKRKRHFKRRMEIQYLFKRMLKRQFRRNLGYVPDFEHPKTLNEKLQWFKMHVRDPRITMCADKYAVRSYVAEKIGGQYLVPLYGVYDSIEEIDIASLPEQFVLKPNHESGRVIICRNKKEMDWVKTADTLNNWLHENYYYEWGEWGYKNIPPKIICEKLLAADIIDYKFFCFGGEVVLVDIIGNRKSGGLYDDFFVDLDFKLIAVGEQSGEKTAEDKILKKPEQWEEMLEIAQVLSEDFPFVRVDLYDVNGSIYFGELTFTPANGMDSKIPDGWDLRMGQLLHLEAFNPQYIIR